MTTMGRPAMTSPPVVTIGPSTDFEADLPVMWALADAARIARNLVLLRDRGVSTAALGVDVANPNQALALSESCGFQVASSATAYREPLPGEPPGPSPSEEATR